MGYNEGFTPGELGADLEPSPLPSPGGATPAARTIPIPDVDSGVAPLGLGIVLAFRPVPGVNPWANHCRPSGARKCRCRS
jgi:hypothetical protein